MENDHYDRAADRLQEDLRLHQQEFVELNKVQSEEPDLQNDQATNYILNMMSKTILMLRGLIHHVKQENRE